MNNSAETNHAVSNYLVDIMNDNSLLFTFLVKREDNGEFSLLYANNSGSSFLTYINKTATEFFTTVFTDQLQELTNTYPPQKQKVISHQKITIENEVYTFDISIMCVNVSEKILGLSMLNRTEELKDIVQLTETKEKYLSLVDNNLDSVLFINQHGLILYTNNIVTKELGYEADFLKDKPIEQFLEESSLQSFQLMMKQTLSGYPTEMHNCLIQHEKGHYITTYVKVIPVTFQHELQGFHLIFRDTPIILDEQDQLVYLAYHDHLTGLWNRRALKEHLRENLIQAEIANSEISIIRIDLDRFKLINESLGYNYGDELLKKIGDRLSLNIDKSSNLYRQSGDEFVYIIKGKTREQTSDFAESILKELSKPIYLDHQEYFVTASIGIAMYPFDGKKLDELLIKADQALYVAKDRGRAHYRYFQEQMNLSFPNEALMESHLRRAIEKEELSIHFQPQVNLITGEINSFEALLRWNNRKFGYVSPMQFIPIAEESGIIMQIGDWVLEEVCKQLKYWQEKGYRPVRIAVNISPKQFKQENFVAKINEKINKYHITPQSLEVEITESAMTDMQDTFTILKDLKDIGVFISIDDFGTGYSSLSYLKKYPIDIIKIDQSFIKDMEVDEKNAAIATTIIQLAHSLGMEVIAEGVEKDKQVEILKAANCQKAQGYYFSRPIPIDDINKSYMFNT